MFVAFTATALNIQVETALTFWLMCLLLVGYLHVAASGAVIVAAFYAMGNTMTPVKIGVIGFIANVGLKYFGYLIFGMPGLVLSTSIYYVGNMLVTCMFLERIINDKSSR